MNILNKLTIKHLKMNKKRTIVTIIGVILSCALMVGIGLLASTLRDYMIKEIIDSNGSHHLMVQNVSSSKTSLLKNNQNIKNYKILSEIGYSYIDNNEEMRSFNYYYIGAGDEKLLKDLPLKEGRLPENSTEIVISNDININFNKNYQIGDEITLEIGKRYLGDLVITKHDEYYSDPDNSEELKDFVTKTYKIVGTVDNNSYDRLSYFCYFMYTKYDDNMDNNFTTYITLNNPKKGYEIGDAIAHQLGFDDKDSYYSNVRYNDSLLSMSGASKYDNITSAMSSVIAIVLSLVSVACIIVIYNSFAISVMERKKQFGLFSSIGATKKQLRKTVFFEALIIGAIAIPLGIASGILGIWIVLQIINNLLSDVFVLGGFSLAIYPIFIIIPILFMIIVILISAFLPARKASKITPIEAIRLNDDIKIKGKKIKTNKLVKKLFGVEGEIALKNMKRNKSKYRITVVSLFISIVLFISFSSILKYGLIGSTEALGDIDFDISVSSYERSDVSVNDKLYNDLLNAPGVEKGILTSNFQLFSEIDKNDLDKDFYDLIKLGNESKYGSTINIIIVDDKSYNDLKKELNLTNDQPVIINQYRYTDYSNNNRKTKMGKLFKEHKDLKLILQYYNYTSNTDGSVIVNPNSDSNSNTATFELSNFVFTDKIPFGLKIYIMGYTPTVIVTDDYLETVMKDQARYDNISYTQMMFKVKDAKGITEKYDSLKENIDSYTYFTNVSEQLKMVRNMIFVIKLLLYGFISLVTLIGVTSVFNTINTSIALRRKEFSVLRSIGLTPKGFNKILRFETLMFGVKSLFYALPVSIGVTYLLYKSIRDVIGLDFMLPWNSIMIAVLAVFIIVSIAMTYATAKIKHENILDAIREENI